MPPRIRVRAPVKLEFLYDPFAQCSRYATVATAITPASSHGQIHAPRPSIQRFPRTQPPSYKPPELRTTQLIREYVSLLNTTPLFLLFQHNNLKANEWIGVRRELNSALKKLDDAQIAEGRPENAIGSGVKLEIVRTNMFEPALRIAEYFRPGIDTDAAITHAVSRQAYEEAIKHRGKHPLTPLLAGPVAILTFPSVSPQYLKAALQILSPSAPQYPAPTRRANPGYWDFPVQDGLKKLLLLGARVEGKVFDMEKTKWVGTIPGGIDGLRAQLVQLLQGIGGGITGALESASRNLYFTMEGRKNMLEEAEKGDGNGEDKPAQP